MTIRRTDPVGVRAETEATRDHLRAYVVASGLSEDDVAQKAGLKPSDVSGMMVPGTGLRFDLLFSVLEALDVLPEQFFGSLYGLLPTA